MDGVHSSIYRFNFFFSNYPFTVVKSLKFDDQMHINQLKWTRFQLVYSIDWNRSVFTHIAHIYTVNIFTLKAFICI